MSKFLIVFILSSVVSICTIAQVPHFSKYQINQSGRYAYFPSVPGTATVEKSEDGSDVYTLEVEFNSTFYGIIMVDFTDGLMDAVSKEDMEETLISYLDFLQTQLNITKSAGYGKGHTLESNSAAIGVIDYWEDATGEPWAVKGWVDKNTLAVMYIYGVELPAETQQLFLNGFRFN